MCDHPLDKVQFLRLKESRQFCARCSANECERILALEMAHGSIVFHNKGVTADHRLLIMADYNAYIRQGAH